MTELSISELQKDLRVFAQERDWEKFHNPKNISMLISIEAAELLELYLWLTPEESRSQDSKFLEKVEEEIADVFINCIRFADIAGIDMKQAVKNKLKKNRERYPADLVRGKAHKYTEYENGNSSFS